MGDGGQGTGRGTGNGEFELKKVIYEGFGLRLQRKAFYVFARRK